MRHGKRVRVGLAMNGRAFSLSVGSIKAGKRVGVVVGFKRPPLSTIKVATSISGSEKRFKTILEKKADYKKPIYMV